MKTHLTKSDLIIIASMLPDNNLGRMYATRLTDISNALKPFEFICAGKGNCRIQIDRCLWDAYHHPERYPE